MTVTAESVVSLLRSKGKEKTRITYARHGMPIERTFGVSIADLKAVAKTIKGQQALACQLYETGHMEAMYLAGLVANGAKMSPEQLKAWAEGSAHLPMISEYIVPWVTVENAAAYDLAREWAGSKKECVASSGWCTLSGLVAIRGDETLNLKEIEKLLGSVATGIAGAENRTRYTMNGFVIAVGCYVKALFPQAKATAHRIGTVSVNVGDTACKVPVASEYILKMEKANRIGAKRKTIRC